jgi:hypothetical protein
MSGFVIGHSHTKNDRNKFVRSLENINSEFCPRLFGFHQDSLNF